MMVVVCAVVSCFVILRAATSIILLSYSKGLDSATALFIKRVKPPRNFVKLVFLQVFQRHLAILLRLLHV